MTTKGICKVQMLVNGRCVMTVCGDKEVFNKNEEQLLINRQRFIQLVETLLYKYTYQEYKEKVEAAVRGNGKPLNVSKAALKLAHYGMKDWTVEDIIKGDTTLLDRYQRIMKQASTSQSVYQLVFQ